MRSDSLHWLQQSNAQRGTSAALTWGSEGCMGFLAGGGAPGGGGSGGQMSGLSSDSYKRTMD
eukprot:1161469-Pelagomonas_calceolata.AAC.31